MTVEHLSEHPRAATKTIPELFDQVPQVFQRRHDPEAPWALVGEALEEILEGLPSEAVEIGVPPGVHLLGDRVVIGKGTRIGPGAVIEGPVWIGEDVEIRAGAYLRGGCWIGDGALVGANTEVKHSILFPTARAPHMNYVGDSVLGSDVNLGAGTVLSNFRHDGDGIDIPTGAGRLPTGRRKLGAVLGDGVLTGCNCVLNPGTVVGRHTQLYPGLTLRPGLYPAGSIVKLRQEVEVVAKGGT